MRERNHDPQNVGVAVAVPDGVVCHGRREAEVLFDFTSPDAATEWQTVNDGVMGGVSEGNSNYRRQDPGVLRHPVPGRQRWFCVVRTKAKKLDLEKGDTLVAKVRGDGREYSLNLYVNKPLIAFSYRATVQTKKDEWIEIKVPLDKFEATSFGNLVKDAGPVNPTEVNALGFLLGDKKAGPFKLEVEWIQVQRAGASE